MRRKSLATQSQDAPLFLSGMPLLADLLKNRESDAIYKVLTAGEEVSQIVNGQKRKCEIRLDTNCLSLYLFQGGAAKPRVSIDINELREVREGFLTQGLLNSRERLGLEEDHVLSLVVQQKGSSLVTVYDFHFENQLMREWWLSSLKTLVTAMSEVRRLCQWSFVVVTHLRSGAGRFTWSSSRG